MERPLRLALLGVSHPHAPGMVRQIHEHPAEFEVVTLFNTEPKAWSERVTAWQRELPELRIVGSVDEAVAADIDAVMVEGAVQENVSLAREAVVAGYPVLLEKPAGASATEFEELMQLAAQRELHVQMIYLFRYMAAIQAMFDFARDGHFGQIYEFRGRLPKSLDLYDEHERDFAQFGGGMFFEMAGHLIDFAVQLLGPPSNVWSTMRHDHPARRGKFIDNGVTVLDHPSATSIIEVTALEAAPGARRIEVYGTEGAFVIPHLGSGHLENNATQDYLTWRQGESSWRHHAPPVAQLQISDLREFAAVVAGQRMPTFSKEHDLQVHHALLNACGMQ